MYNTLKLFLVFGFITITTALNAQQILAVKGKVETIEGRPLTNITVSIFGKNFTNWSVAVTDSLGEYAIPSVYNGDTLYFSALEIEGKRMIVEGNNYILARVQQAINYRRGAVVEEEVDSLKAYPPQKRRPLFFHYSALTPAPFKTWRDFENEVKKELKYPSAAIKNQTQGVVVVGLTIANTGAVKHLKIIKGIGSGCDEEVLRIMKLHPKWRPGIENGRPVGGEVEYAVTFRLKGK
nr:energy transducer TonB [Mucilaginibacter sp. L294]